MQGLNPIKIHKKQIFVKIRNVRKQLWAWHECALGVVQTTISMKLHLSGTSMVSSVKVDIFQPFQKINIEHHFSSKDLIRQMNSNRNKICIVDHAKLMEIDIGH